MLGSETGELGGWRGIEERGERTGGYIEGAVAVRRGAFGRLRRQSWATGSSQRRSHRPPARAHTHQRKASFGSISSPDLAVEHPVSCLFAALTAPARGFTRTAPSISLRAPLPPPRSDPVRGLTRSPHARSPPPLEKEAANPAQMCRRICVLPTDAANVVAACPDRPPIFAPCDPLPPVRIHPLPATSIHSRPHDRPLPRPITLFLGVRNPTHLCARRPSRASSSMHTSRVYILDR